jgi:Gamma-glutamyltransferase
VGIRIAQFGLLLSLCACSSAPVAVSQNPEPASVPRAIDGPAARTYFPPGWKYPAGGVAQFAEHAMVASSSRAAAAAGAEILKAGGNAVDAAVATGFALTVAYPEAGNIGGGGYMVIRMADGRTAALDYREMAPAAAFREMYIDSAGRLTNGGIQGRSASGVPGVIGGLTAALAKYGSMPLARVMEPAIRMASEGIVVDSALAPQLMGRRQLS